MSIPQVVCIGKLTAPHGVRGEIKFLSYLEDTSYLFLDRVLCDAQGKILQVTSLRSGPKGFFLIKLEGVTSRDMVDAWKGKDIYMDRVHLPQKLEKETYYREDLVGLDVQIAPSDVSDCSLMAGSTSVLSGAEPVVGDATVGKGVGAPKQALDSLVVSAVHNFGAGDILEVRNVLNQTSYFVPFRQEAVPTVALDRGFVVINAAFLLENEGKPSSENV